MYSRVVKCKNSVVGNPEEQEELSISDINCLSSFG